MDLPSSQACRTSVQKAVADHVVLRALRQVQEVLQALVFWQVQEVLQAVLQALLLRAVLQAFQLRQVQFQEEL